MVPWRPHLGDPAATRRAQLVVGGGPGGRDGAGDAAAVVRLPAIRAANSAHRSPAKTRWLWESTNPGSRVASVEIDPAVGGRGRAAAGRSRRSARPRRRRRRRCGSRVGPAGAVAGDELADAGDHRRARVVDLMVLQVGQAGGEQPVDGSEAVLAVADHPTTADDHVTDVGSGGAVVDLVRSGAGGADRVGSTTTKSAGAPPRSGRRRASPGGVAGRAGGGDQLGRGEPAALARWPAVRAAPARAAPRTGRSPRAGREPRLRRAAGRRPAGAPARCRRPGPVRWWGRSRRAVPVPPSRAMSSSVRWVACTAVVGGPSSPCRASSSVGRAAVEGLHRGVLGRLLAEVDVQRPGRDAASADRARSLAGHGPDRVDGRADPHGAGPACRPAKADPCRPAVDAPVGEPLLHRVERLVALAGQTAAQVAGVEQGEPDAGLGGRRDQRRAHGVRVGVRRPPRSWCR